MPELPEVETIRNDLNKQIINKKIIGIRVNKQNMVIGSVADFKSILKNKKIIMVDRIGKLILIQLNVNAHLLIHLKMTGQLIYKQNKKIVAGGHGWPSLGTLPNKYSHIIIKFYDNSELFFNDQRQFGFMQLVDKNTKQEIIEKFGIEPGKDNFTLKKFVEIFENKKAVIKSILLNQQLIAGIGNIYADEICFCSGIKPSRRANKLTKKDINSLWQNTKKVIKSAIDKRGTTFNDYVDTDGKQGNFVKFLKVYGREGKKCTRCRNIIKKIKLNGRGTHYCSKCQK